MEKIFKPIHLACVYDDKKPNMRLVKISNGIATALNGRIVVKMDLKKTSKLTSDQLALLDGKYIHMRVWKMICEAERVEFEHKGITLWGGGIKSMFEYNLPQGEFYSVDEQIQGIIDEGVQAKGSIGYKPELTDLIKKIFGSEVLSMDFYKKGIFIFPAEDEGLWALIMPVKIGEKEREIFI